MEQAWRLRWQYGLGAWPGLYEVWTGRAASGAALAIAATLVLNGGLVTTFVWRELLADSWRLGLWGVLGLFWLACALATCRQIALAAAERSSQRDPEYEAATASYLKGDWAKAEEHLQRILGRRAGDADCILQLATVCRRAGRYDEAHRLLRRCRRADRRGKWTWELEQEREKLTRLWRAAPRKHHD